MTPAQRQHVIAEARSWIGTPYHDQANLKGHGADCAHMPLAVYSAVLFPALGIVPPPLPKWTMQWHLHRSEELYLNYVRALGAIEVVLPEPGDFVLFRMGRTYAHGAIVLDWPHLIHACNPRGVLFANAALDERLSRTSRTQPLFFTF